MSSFVDTTTAVFAKDLLTELRTKHLLPTMVMLGVLTAWIFRIAGGARPADRFFIAAGVMLMTMLFAAVLACEKAFSVEQHDDCMSSLLLSPADPGDIYLAKLLVNVAMLTIFEIVTVPVVLLLFAVNPGADWPRLVLVLALCNVGISSVGTLLGCLVQGAGAAGSLLSILLMAALSPVVIPAVSALLLSFNDAPARLAGSGAMGMVGGFGHAVGYIAAFDAIYVTVCWLLFGFVVEQ